MGQQIKLLNESEGSRLSSSDDGDPHLLSSDGSLPILGAFLIGAVLTFIVLFFAGLLPTNRTAVFASSSISEELESFAYEREVHVQDNLKPYAELIYGRLPFEQTNFSWSLFPSAVAERLKAIPLFIAPSIERCSLFSVSCFRVSAGLRNPEMLTQLNGQWWLVDMQGRFLMPADDVSQSLLPKSFGLEGYANSPELLQTVTAQLVRVMKRLELKTGYEVTTARLVNDQRLEIQFTNISAAFLLDPTDIKGPKLDERAAQIRSIMAGQLGVGDSVQKVDLRYSEMAILTKAEAKPAA